ncbi:hypothetical protein [Moritella viscosa]|uniref:Uncharacterized protein n=1 Tax=Moritella viscosa TaxID=80854 RepID=A0A1L0AHM3_9GAMM|nr:hypothetical protein [Moritella viscosa]SGZ02315.1 Putative uncharacterized protein [Moritella viscosa]SGZ15282.1 Putative uncharacterized protein [Moritella viscosa]SGZ16182.1 Putative uncharacterized protein [Moritella viscosa]SHO28105.1 Putative uncharacterized protein [Moritella viscosa]
MSLISKKQPAKNREQLTTESAVIESQKIEKRAYQKEHRARTLAAYNEQAAIIKELKSDNLAAYVANHSDNSHDVRTGLHSMKVNAYELAVIKQAIELTGSKGSRDLYIKLCKQIIIKGGILD